jgi:alcohol dehydrogenase (cytochrome c)
MNVCRVLCCALLLAGAVIAQSGPTQKELNNATKTSVDWMYVTHDYFGQRFVNLKSINTKNAAKLQVVCSYQSPELVPSQTNPLVYAGTMYITTAHTTAALDAADCSVQWLQTWKPKGREEYNTNRGAAIKEGILVRGTPDGYLLAMDMKSGKQIWERQIADPTEGYFLSMPPAIFDDLVIIGPAGADWGMKGWVGAFRLKDGEPVWKFNTIPDPDEAAAETWGSKEEVLKYGGGSLWTPLSIDSESGTVYVPVGNPAPDFYDNDRPGSNLYTGSVVALDAHTGKLEWYNQVTPHDVHDWDLTQVSPLFTATVKGASHKVITVAGKDGLLRLFDRDSHTLLVETPFTTRDNGLAPMTVEGTHFCPGPLGGEEWNGPAYSHLTGLLYVPANDWCATVKKDSERPVVGKGPFFMGGEFTMDPPEKNGGWLSAIDPATGDMKWRYHSSKPMLAAVTATSGGLVFTGEVAGNFLALDAANGKILYKHNLGGPVAGGVVTYTVHGRQFVGVVTGNVSVFFNALSGVSVGGTPTVVVFALPEK